MSMDHTPADPAQLARWEGFPDTSLGTFGVVTHGRCWHRSIECSLYRGATNRLVSLSDVEPMTARQAKDQGWGLCSKCAEQALPERIARRRPLASDRNGRPDLLDANEWQE